MRFRVRRPKDADRTILTTTVPVSAGFAGGEASVVFCSWHVRERARPKEEERASMVMPQSVRLAARRVFKLPKIIAVRTYL